MESDVKTPRRPTVTAAERAQAREVSLRQAGTATWPGAGLDDPHRAQPGDPLGARLQTFLRERFLTAPRPAHGALDHWAPRWVDQTPTVPAARSRTQCTGERRSAARETCQ